MFSSASYYCVGSVLSHTLSPPLRLSLAAWRLQSDCGSQTPGEEIHVGGEFTTQHLPLDPLFIVIQQESLCLLLKSLIKWPQMNR